MNADTVVLFPKKIDFPTVNIDGFLTQVVEDIITILKNPPEPKVPSLESGDETNNVQLKIVLLFDRMDGTNKKLPMQHKQTINIAQQKLVPLPTAPVPPVSPLMTHLQKKTGGEFTSFQNYYPQNSPPIPSQ